MTTILQRAIAAAAGTCALLIAGTAQAALQDRDLDGDTIVDAFYDTDLDITWLRDANPYGKIRWDDAVAWASGYSFAGYSDWRLPTSDTCSGYNCTGSEMGHLWYVELGNSAGGPMTNTGGFQDLQSGSYWSGTEHYRVSTHALAFDTIEGSQFGAQKRNAFYVMAVRPGDVPAVPEPGTYGLMALGLLGVGAVARRRRTG
jgi:hypothetical protein